MEFGTIEREIFVEAAPDVVYEVVSSPAHLRQWWPDEARFEPVPGTAGEIAFGDKVVNFAVVDTRPPHTFTFRWDYPTGETPAPGNSYLVTFELTPTAGGTRLKMTETGFRERGWAAAQLEQQYQDHVNGWNHFLPRLNPYVTTLPVRR